MRVTRVQHADVGKCLLVIRHLHPCTISLMSAAEIFPKACSDGNAAALDKALEALVVFTATASDQTIGRVARSASAGIVSKCLGARPSTQQKGIDALLQLIEADQAEKVVVRAQISTPLHLYIVSTGTACTCVLGPCPLVGNAAAAALWVRKRSVVRRAWLVWGCLQPEIVEGYGNKVPKVVVGALDATLAAVRCAGHGAKPRAWER